MNKKAIATPLFVIFIVIILSTSIFLIKSNEKKDMVKFSIGETQSEIISAYLQSEKDNLFYEKLVEFNEYKSVKEFAETLPEIDGSFDFRGHFREILENNLKEYSPSITLGDNLMINFGKKKYYIQNQMLKLTYEREFIIAKQPIIDFSLLEGIKENGEYRIGQILNEDLEDEDIYTDIRIKYKPIF